LAPLLKNRTYIGEINHRDRSYPGEHQPIVERNLFEAVQAKLKAQSNITESARAQSASLLQGKLFDDAGHLMTPSNADCVTGTT
jgi:site-specific DNA recombinase